MIYLDNAATSRFKPLKVKIAAIKEINRSANPGRSSHKASIRAAEKIEECRAEIQDNFFAGNVVFTKNCTEALNLAIFGSQPEKQVIATSMEHNSVLRPLKKLADNGRIKFTVITPDEKGDFSDSLATALRRPTSLAVFTAMSNVTGRSCEMKKYADMVKSASDALVLADMAQGAGHLKIDFSSIDMCAFAGHKSLHGLQGTGFLLAKPEIRLKPLIYGGTGTSSLSLEQPQDFPEGMESGTLNTVGIAALTEGIRWTYENFGRLNSKIKKLTEYLYRQLKNIDTLKIHSAENGIVLCNFSNITCSEAADILDADYGICVRSGLHCAPLAHRTIGTLPYGAIRFGIGWDNTFSEMDKVAAAMEEISHKRP